MAWARDEDTYILALPSGDNHEIGTQEDAYLYFSNVLYGMDPLSIRRIVDFAKALYAVQVDIGDTVFNEPLIVPVDFRPDRGNMECEKLFAEDAERIEI